VQYLGLASLGATLLCGAADDRPAVGLDQQQLCSSVYEDRIEMER